MGAYHEPRFSANGRPLAGGVWSIHFAASIARAGRSGVNSSTMVDYCAPALFSRHGISVFDLCEVIATSLRIVVPKEIYIDLDGA